MLVKAIVDGFGGAKRVPSADFTIPKEAQDAMQRSAVSAIATKADPKWLPVQLGRDKGLPPAPTFDFDVLQQRGLKLRKSDG